MHTSRVLITNMDIYSRGILNGKVLYQETTATADVHDARAFQIRPLGRLLAILITYSPPVGTLSVNKTRILIFSFNDNISSTALKGNQR